MYKNLLKNLSQKIENYFSEIEARYNFDLGSEFEMALCKILQDLLPTKFGICRGFIVDKEGNEAGDDIIIYGRLRFPSIRMLGQDNFAQKERIPFEAVYCYIEAKHNLELDKVKESTLNKALNQIQKIKSLKRSERSLSQITEACNLGKNFELKAPNESWANKWNPLYTGIISRRTSLKSDGENSKKGLLDPNATYQLLHRNMSIECIPDLLVAGNGVLGLPTFNDQKHLMPFNEPNHCSGFCIFKTKYNALAVGLCQLLWAPR